MTINSLLVALKEVEVLLKAANLLKYKNTSKKQSILNNKLSAEFLSVMHSNNYDNIYKTAMKNGDFDFVLFDDSFLQFSANKAGNSLIEGEIRYAYFQNPREYKTYQQFLLEHEIDYGEAGECFSEEYEQYVAEAKLKAFVTPIRYDYDYNGYSQDQENHSISHLHIGRESDFRVPISKIITPQTFTIMLIKNMYFEYWKKALKIEEFREIFNASKKQCEIVDSQYFSDNDKLHLYLY